MATLLLVEDDPSGAETMKIALEEIGGFEVVTATNIQDANRYLDKFGCPDVAILDWILEDGTSESIAERIRRDNCGSKVVLATAMSHPEKLDGLPVDLILRKPFGLEELIEAVKVVTFDRSA